MPETSATPFRLLIRCSFVCCVFFFRDIPRRKSAIFAKNGNQKKFKSAAKCKNSDRLAVLTAARRGAQSAASSSPSSASSAAPAAPPSTADFARPYDRRFFLKRKNCNYYSEYSSKFFTVLFTDFLEPGRVFLTAAAKFLSIPPSTLHSKFQLWKANGRGDVGTTDRRGKKRNLSDAEANIVKAAVQDRIAAGGIVRLCRKFSARLGEFRAGKRSEGVL